MGVIPVPRQWDKYHQVNKIVNYPASLWRYRHYISEQKKTASSFPVGTRGEKNYISATSILKGPI